MDYSVSETSKKSDNMIIQSEPSPTNSTKNILNFSVDRLLACDRDCGAKQNNYANCTSMCGNNSNGKCHPEEIQNLDEIGNKIIRPMPIRISGAPRDHRGLSCGDASPVIPSIMRFTHLFTPTYTHSRSFYGMPPPPQNPSLRPTITTMETPDPTSTVNQSTNSSSTKRKRSWSRAVFSNLQRKGLEIAFGGQKYITKPDRRKLAARLGLTDAQVKVWFQNRRMKWRHTGEEKNCPNKRSTFDKDEAFVGAEDDEIDVVSD
ncbi:H2.0-like homeobox protein [Lutzomyia longipalpis]|uniref:H2.0-like homeobox protein n=1 Tax=Lutzomyia longipalpis TaxID=7200 RepID=UPI0024837DF0|nr:H2.0-like homeobox protein [Lutzomyia longipalpis]